MLFQIAPATIAPVVNVAATDPGNSGPHAVLDTKTLLVKGRSSAGGVQFVNIEDPVQPKIVGGWSTGAGSQGRLSSLASVSGRIFGINGFGELVELKQTSPTTAEAIDLHPSGRLAVGSSVDRIGLVHSIGVTVLQFPVSGPPASGRIQIVGGCSPSSSRPLAIDGDWVFTDRALVGECPTNELVAIDFSDLTRPAIVARARVDQRIAFVQSAKDLVYAGLASGQVKVYRFKDRELTFLGEFRGIHSAVSALYAQGVLYWGLASGGFQLFDVRDPSHIRPLGGYAGVETPTFSTDGQWLRVVSSRGDLQVFPLVDFRTLELEARLTDSGRVILEVRGRPGESVEIQRLIESEPAEWVAAGNLELETGYASLDLGLAAPRQGLFRAIRR